MAQPEYKDIRDGDWQNLRYAIRRCNERLSDLEGYGGEKTRYANLKMDGNRLRNGPPDQQTAEGDEFITKDYLKSYKAMEIINPGEIRGITNSGGTGGTTSVSTYEGPRIYKDFTDTQRWQPVGAASSAVNMRVLKSGVTLSGIKNYGNPNQGDLFSGVVSTGTLYPSSQTGNLSFRCTFSNYTVSTDVPMAERFLHGMMVIPSYPGFVWTGSRGVFGGMGVSEVALLDGDGNRVYMERPIITSEYENGTPMVLTAAQSTHFNLLKDGEWWTLKFTFSPRNLTGDLARTMFLTNVYVYGGDQIQPPQSLSLSGPDSGIPYGMMALLGGVRIALGCWPQDNSSVGSAKLYSFELLDGYMYW